MKIAVGGKGGVGKTTISGTLARQLARNGKTVIALDCDPSPNMGIPLGLTHDQLFGVKAVFNHLVEIGHTHHDPKPDPEDMLRLLGTPAADGVMLLATGEVVRRDDACMCCGSHASTRSLFGELVGDGRIIVGDLEAGLNDIIWAKPEPEDMLLAVAEPSVKSIDIARRAVRIGQVLGLARIYGIANRVRTPDDERAVADALGVPVFAVPEDPALARADMLGVAPLDLDPTSPAMLAVAAIAERVAEPEASAAPVA